MTYCTASQRQGRRLGRYLEAIRKERALRTLGDGDEALVEDGVDAVSGFTMTR